MDFKPKLALGMIVKFDEPVELVERAIDSVKDYVDGIFITITKFNDTDDSSKLEKLLKKYKANISYFKWVYDFSAARNFNISQIPKEYNFFCWIDSDDVWLNPENIPLLLEDSYKHNIAAVYINYLYQVDLDKNGDVREILIEHKRERIVRNDNTFKWVGRLHEILIEQRTENVVKILRKECSVLHLSTPDRIDKNLGRNIRILEEQAKEEQHKDPRTVLYLAKAYFDRARFQPAPEQAKIDFDLALNLLNEYLNGAGNPGSPGYQEGSGWNQERATAWQYIAQIAIINKKYNVAVRALHNAIIESPEFPIYYVDMAMVLTEQGQYAKAKHWLDIATNMKMPESTIITTPRDLKTKALEVDYNIALHELDMDRAVRDSKMLCEILPDVKELKDRHTTVLSLQRANKACQSIVFLGKYLEELKETNKIPYLLQAIPEGLQQEKFVSEMKHQFLPIKKWGDREIAILCGPGFETWSDLSVDKGIGGSEEAVIYLAKELVRLGWSVTVYGNPSQDAGVRDGITWKMWYDLNVKDEFNVLILWRSIGFVDFNPRAKFIAVWNHDCPNVADWTEERIKKVDKIFVLSEYHKSLFRMSKNGEFIDMPEDKMFVTANGINPVNLSKEIKRNPYRCIWTSSYDRGLNYLLKMWPDVKKEVPEAELHIFYGWNLYDFVWRGNPAKARWKQQMIQMMDQPGVFEHGRVSHKQLEEEFQKSGIWSYCSTFTEISCISAMKAQVYGSIPVVTNFAALTETVKNGIRIEGDPYDPTTQEEYKKALISLLKDHKRQEEIRGTMQTFAKDYFLWSKIAQEWSTLFDTQLNLNLPKLEGKEVVK